MSYFVVGGIYKNTSFNELDVNKYKSTNTSNTSKVLHNNYRIYKISRCNFKISIIIFNNKLTLKMSNIWRILEIYKLINYNYNLIQIWFSKIKDNNN